MIVAFLAACMALAKAFFASARWLAALGTNGGNTDDGAADDGCRFAAAVAMPAEIAAETAPADGPPTLADGADDGDTVDPIPGAMAMVLFLVSRKISSARIATMIAILAGVILGSFMSLTQAHKIVTWKTCRASR